jgi:hypothetical protein
MERLDRAMQGIGDPPQALGADDGVPMLDMQDDVAGRPNRSSKLGLRHPAMFTDKSNP